MELLNSKVDHPGHQCDRTSFGAEVVRCVGSPALRLLYDGYHMQMMEGDLSRTIQANFDLIGHGHTAGAPAEAVTAGAASSGVTGAGAGAGPAAGGNSVPTMLSTCSGTSGSVNTSAAFASTARARVVSRPGSPGPDPTNRMRPGFGLRPRMLICSLPLFHELARTQLEQLRGHREPQLSSPTGSSDAGRADHVGSVQRRHAAAQRQFVEDVPVLIDRFDHLGDRADRCGTTRLQLGEQDTLRGDRRSGVSVVERRQQFHQRRITGTALDRQRPLSRCRQHLYRLQRLGDDIEASDAGESRPGHHDGTHPTITLTPPSQAGAPEVVRGQATHKFKVAFTAGWFQSRLKGATSLGFVAALKQFFYPEPLAYGLRVAACGVRPGGHPFQQLDHTIRVYAPDIFKTGAFIAASGGFASIAVAPTTAISLSVLFASQPQSLP